MTSNDVRDMLDLPGVAAAGPRPAKKQKIAGPRPNLKGLQREVQSLGGDNPIAIVPTVPLFKKRRLANRKPAARWDLKPFRNSARTDGLVLRHWRRVAESAAAPAAADGEEKKVESEEQQENGEQEKEVKKEEDLDDSFFAKYNVKVNIPTYDDEQYDSKLKSDDWSREETDYLIQLCRDYDLRWPVIWDRYDYATAAAELEQAAEGESQALVPERKIRDMEDLKARYYEVAAKMMSVQRPVQFMSQAEFTLHQLMTSYNPQQERLRKHFAETAMSRSAEERREEESLLIELKRIMARSERLNEERKELYSRLEAPPSTSNVGIYTTSQGLQQLVQQLMNVDKSKKRKSLLGPEGVSPATGGPSGQNVNGTDRRDSGHRESITTTPATTKKGNQATPHERRKLSEEEEVLYGVSHHDRLTGGPSFRHDKVTRQITNKSAVQAAKITNMLTELEIPTRLIMPTVAVTHAYENLLASINTLIDTKKVADKLDAEIKLAEAQKAEKERKARRERGEPDPPPAEEKKDDKKEDSKAKDKATKDEPATEDDSAAAPATSNGEDADGEVEAEADVSMQDVNGTADDQDADKDEEEDDDADADADGDEDTKAEAATQNGDEDHDEDEEGETDVHADADADADGDEDEAEPEPEAPEVKIEGADKRERNASAAPSTRSNAGSLHKRSASVLSESQGSEKGSKRLKK